MHLKEIEIKGFKSFANKIKLNITPGITVIVGPNGCGKSNITDAVRWILGEQNIHSLRGEKMTDMIFSGNSDQKIRNIAEVSMLFDNIDRKLSLDSEEVELKRVIFRSGETENYINGIPCKLRDIHELFWGTGIGKNAYSIIAQGKVDFVLNAKPIERRILFEEASNISSYNNKKENALKKLDLVENNLLRTNDILLEVQESLSHYKKKADDLELYRLCHEHIKKLEFYILSQQYLLYQKNINKNKKTLSILQNEMANIEKILIDSKKNITQIEMEKEQFEQQLSNSEILLQENDRNKNSLNNQLIVLKQKRLEIDQRIINIQEDTKRAYEQFKKFKDTISDINKDIRETNQNSIIIKENFNRENSLLKKYCHILECYQQKVIKFEVDRNEFPFNHFNQYREETIKEETVINSLKVSLLEIEKEKQNIHHELQSNKNKLDNIEKNMIHFENEINRSQREKVQIERLIASNKLFINQKTDMIRNYENDIILRIKEKDFLEELRKNNQDQNKNISLDDNIFNEKLRQNIQWFGKMFNLIEDIPDKLKNVMHFILHDEMHLIRVGHSDHIPDIVRLLKSKNLRQIRIVADNMIAQKVLDTKKINLNNLEKKKILGFANQLISYPSEYSNFFKIILGHILIVEDMITAFSIFKQQSREQWVIVSLDGIILDSQGIITFNHQSENNHYDEYHLSIKKIDQLEQEIQHIQSEIRQQKEVLENRKNDHQKLCHKMDSMDQHLEGLMLRFHEEKNHSIEIDKKNTDLDNQLELLNQRKNIKEQSKKGLEKKILTSHLNMKQIEEYMQSFHSYTHCISRFKSVCDKKTEELRKKLENTKMKLTWNNEREILLQKREKEMNHFIQNYQQAERERQAKIMQSKKEQKQFMDQEEILKEKLKIIMENRKKINQDKIYYEESIKKQNTILRTTRENIETNQKKMEEKKNIYHECEMNHVQNQEKINNLLDTIKNQYHTSINEILAHKNEIKSQKEASDKIAQHKEQISLMGQINFDALQEYHKQSIRYNELQSKKEDIIESKENLINLMNEIDRVAEKHFYQTFIKIENHFNGIFQKLFRGGQVRLELTNDKKLLETGIEVMVQPPGKKVQNISLLSTGEKALTAIALLFAMWKANPSPFCFFDEIDSALDETNALRLASFIKNEDLKDAQMIIITHQKEVMEAADALYGITMEGSGVSKLMSLKMLDSGEWQN